MVAGAAHVLDAAEPACIGMPPGTSCTQPSRTRGARTRRRHRGRGRRARAARTTAPTPRRDDKRSCTYDNPRALQESPMKPRLSLLALAAMLAGCPPRFDAARGRSRFASRPAAIPRRPRPRMPTGEHPPHRLQRRLQQLAASGDFDGDARASCWSTARCATRSRPAPTASAPPAYRARWMSRRPR